MALTIRGLASRVRKWLEEEWEERQKNLQAWRQVATQPKLRGEFTRYVIRPRVEAVGRKIEPIREFFVSPETPRKFEKWVEKLPELPETLQVGVAGMPPLVPLQRIYKPALKMAGSMFLGTPEEREKRVRLAKLPPAEYWRTPEARQEAIDLAMMMSAGVVKKTPRIRIKPPKIRSLSDDDLVKQLTEALEKAKPLRGIQEKLYTRARGQKLAKLLRAREKMAGERGFYEELGALKGELPKVEFESVRQYFNQEAVDRLFNMIKRSNRLDHWEKVNAQVGLYKILGEKGGAIPTKKEIEHLYQVFGRDFTEALLSRRPFFQKLKEAGMQLYNLPRSMMTGVGDFSATLLQNIMFAYRHPKITARNFVEQLKFFANEKAYKAAMEEIYSRPTFKKMKDARLSFTEVGPIMSKREEAFMASWAEKIPGLGKLVRATSRAYTGFLNKMRADVFDQLYRVAKEVGADADNPEFLKNLGYFINAATGRGSLGKLERTAPILTQGLFSARKLAATVNLLNPAFYIRADPFIRKEALKTWMAYLGGGMTILGLAKLAGAETSEDPTSADFGKIKIGNTRFNIWGTYQQMARLITQLLKGYVTSSTTGKRIRLGEGYKPLTRMDILGRFFEMKEHPTLSYLKGAISGQTQLGQPFQWAPELLDRFIPMLVNDAYDLYQEHGPIGLLALIPAALGVPVQTYGRKMPVIEKTAAGKETIRLRFYPGLSEQIVSKITGRPLSEIPKFQWKEIAQHKELESNRKYLTREANRLRRLVEERKITNEEAEGEMKQIYQRLKLKPLEAPTAEGLLPIAVSLGISEYFGEPPKGTIEKAKWKAGRFKAAVKVYRDENLDESTKDRLIQKLGQSIDDVAYYDIAASNRSVRRATVDEILKTEGKDGLVILRKEVSGKKILTNTIIDDLIEEGIISKAEGNYLKKTRWVKDQKTGKYSFRVSAVGKGKRGKKPPVFKVKIPTVRLKMLEAMPKLRLIGAKAPEPPVIKPLYRMRTMPKYPEAPRIPAIQVPRIRVRLGR